jgi:uncharacterized membrane protein YuzA (DUF378 family)
VGKEKRTLLKEILTFKKIRMKLFNTVITILLIVGGLNWGLIGLFEFNLVQSIFGQETLARIIYTVVGLSAICKVVFWNMEATAE